MGHATAVEIAQKATEYACLEIEGQILHKAKFDLNFCEQACYAFEIARLTSGLSGVLIRVGGTVAPTVYGQYIWIIDILKCYVQSMKCADRKAYCWQVVTLDVPSNIDLHHHDKFILSEVRLKKQVHICYPCKHVLAWRQEINFFHPSSVKDQIHAIAVKACLEWCPSLRIDEAMEETGNLNGAVVEMHQKPAGYIDR